MIEAAIPKEDTRILLFIHLTIIQKKKKNLTNLNRKIDNSTKYKIC